MKDIPSLAKWRLKTPSAGIARLNGRTAAMGRIDDALNAYAGAKGQGDRAAMNRALYALRKACRHWQAGGGGGAVANSVRALEGLAEAELGKFVPGWREFANRKAAGRGNNLRELAPGYRHERRDHVREKAAAFAAGRTPDNPPSASQLRTYLADDPQAAEAALMALGDDEWDQRTRHPAFKANGAINYVEFFDKVSRLEHMLINNGGRLVWVRNNAVFTTPPGQPFMYAMDAYGNLFAHSTAMGANQFNHSSFNAGREVVCAGMIAGQQGRLQFISNDSGHYRPSRLDLYSCLLKLQGAGVDLTRTRVRVVGAGGGDWPAVTHGVTLGFASSIAAATNGHPPQPSGPHFDPWP